MPIFGTDTSKWQPPGTYAPGAFEIVNAEDPNLATKVAAGAAAGRPTDVYVWVYPRASGAVGLILRAKGLSVGRIWFDYEDQGVTPADLVTCFGLADQAGVRSGYYSNPGRLDHTPFLGRPYWLAQYPKPNDGTFRGFGLMDRTRPVNIWQFTSTSGTLDQNVIVDEPWWSGWAGAPPIPQPPKEPEMLLWRASDASGEPKVLAGQVVLFNGVYWQPIGDPDEVNQLVASGVKVTDLLGQQIAKWPTTPPAQPITLSDGDVARIAAAVRPASLNITLSGEASPA